jgi:hypothetical protein
VGPDQDFELGDEGAVVAEVELDPGLLGLGGDAQFIQPGRGLLGVGQVGQVGQRVTAPQAEGLVEQAGGGRPLTVAAGGGRPGLAEQRLEPFAVQLARSDLEQVAALGRDQPAAPAPGQPAPGQRAAQAVDEEVQGLAGRSGLVVAPQRVDQLLGADRPVGVQQQHGQQGARLGPADADGVALGVHDLERAEQVELHLGHAGVPCLIEPAAGAVAHRATASSSAARRSRPSAPTGAAKASTALTSASASARRPAAASASAAARRASASSGSAPMRA